MPGLQRRQEGTCIPVSVVIRKQGYAYVWICKKPVMRGGRKEPCNHQDVVESEAVANAEYEKHKKTTRGH